MASGTVTQIHLAGHLKTGTLSTGSEIGIKIDQTLTQDATGTLVMLELEAMGVDQVKTELSAQYTDHNLLEEDSKNPDDHIFLESACRRFGIWFNRAGNGVSHPVHMAKFGIPGKTLLGSDSHTCAAGSMGMLAIGAGGIEVALAMAGEPFYFEMPEVWGVRLSNQLSQWVSAKDVILEMLRRHQVTGGIGKIIEYYGPGVMTLSAMDRHVIANMGAELGATTTVFPSDERTREFLIQQNREKDWRSIVVDQNVQFDLHDEIDLSKVEPLIARPSSPGNVVPVYDVEGTKIYQSYIGSSANPGFRDFAIVAAMVKGKSIARGVSLDINPSSREILENLVAQGQIGDLIHSGARLHQAGCNGCIGMGQAPATGKNSLRTTPRNFPGRSGTQEDRVWLCSPETAAASALNGAITDPRKMEMKYPDCRDPSDWLLNTTVLELPLELGLARQVKIEKGPNIMPLPDTAPMPDQLEIPIILKVGNDISTDTILPAGARVLPYRSNIPKISEFVFHDLDPDYFRRALSAKAGHAIIAGDNYGQGSSREHAALAPRYLGLRVVLAKRFARIHMANLVNFGILPLVFGNPKDYDELNEGDILRISKIHHQLEDFGSPISVQVMGKSKVIETHHDLYKRQLKILLCGGAINLKKITSTKDKI